MFCRITRVSSLLRTQVRLFSIKKELITDEERFLFDTNGFIIVKGVLTPEEVSQANKSIDERASNFAARTGALRYTTSDSPLKGDNITPRMDLAGFLGWESPACDVFRSILAHTRLVAYYHALIGEGYRLDHSPLIIGQKYGTEGFPLHGGSVSGGKWNHEIAYSCLNGQIRNTLLGVSVALTDSDSGDGGFCVLRGSHKSHFDCPPSLAMFKSPLVRQHIFQPVLGAGDVLLFSEATSHGTLPWTSKERDRRVVLFRLAPATTGYGRAYLSWPETYMKGMSEAQKGVMQPPYGVRLDRPLVALTDSGQVGVLVKERAQEKKDFDKRVFGTAFF